MNTPFVSENGERPSDATDDPFVDLLPKLKDGCSVRDSVTGLVVAGLRDAGDNPQLKLNSLVILRNSVNAYFGCITPVDADARILPRESLDDLIAVDLVRSQIVEPLLRGVYTKQVEYECVKFLHSISAYLPLEVYRPLFDGSMQRFLLSEALEATHDTNENRDIWVASISTLRNLLNCIEMPSELVSRLLGCISGHADEASVQLCHMIVMKVIFPKLSLPQSLDCRFDLKMCKMAIRYLSSVLSSQDRGVLSIALLALVSICEHRLGVDLLLELGSLPNIIKITLTVVDRYDQLLNFTSKQSGANVLGSAVGDMLRSITPKFHETCFDALSVLSKMAFTANRLQIMQMIESGVPEVLVKLLNCPLSSNLVKTRSCNTLGNLGCETDVEVQAIIDVDAFPVLMRIFETDLDYNTKIEAAYAICACISRANRKQIGYIISSTSKCNHIGDGMCVSLMCEMMDFVCKSDPANQGSMKLCKVILSALENILKNGIYELKIYKLCENPYSKMFLDAQGDVRLAKICFFPEYNIATKAAYILRLYFNKPKFWTSTQMPFA